MPIKTSITTTILAIILILITAQAGCIEKQISEERIITNITRAHKELQTYEMEMGMIMSMIGTDGGESIDESTSMQANIAMDIPKKELKMGMTMDIPEEPGNLLTPSSIEIETYIIDTTMYMNMSEMLGMSMGWLKMETQDNEFSEFEDIWKSQNLTKQQEDLLFGASEVTIVGEQMVNGVNCYEINIEPDMEQLFELMFSDEMTGYLTEDIDASKIEMILEILDYYSIIYWYDKSTYLPVKMDIEIIMSDEEKGLNMFFDMKLDMNYISNNEPVTIDLPSDANDAIDMSEMMDLEF